jgi:hypothetical protein
MNESAKGETIIAARAGSFEIDPAREIGLILRYSLLYALKARMAADAVFTLRACAQPECFLLALSRVRYSSIRSISELLIRHIAGVP